jgi:dipeptidyl aminopeptidase/acylaminoacyl peptidase
LKNTFSHIVRFVLFIVLFTACGKAAPTGTASAPAADTATAAPPTKAAVTIFPTLTSGPTMAATDTPVPLPTNTPKPTWTPTSQAKPSNLSYLGPIAYYAGYSDGIAIMNPDGTGRQILVPEKEGHGINFGFTWSPDGQSLAYSTSTWSDIYIYSIKAAKSTNITNMDGKFEMEPDWSPDGTQIAFTGDLKSKNFNIYVMNVDGSRIRQLTECAADCRNPDWSPDGAYIAYENQYDIYVMKSDGSGEQRVAHGGISTYPAWSPDGQHIAMIRMDSYESQRYLYVMNQDGTGMRALTDTTRNPRQFSWSPDGIYIVFDDFGGDSIAAMWILNVESGDLKIISTSLTYAPEWSPIMTAPVNPDDIKPLPDCTSGWSRLQAGGQARVMGDIGSSANRVRSAPETGNNTIAMLPPQTVMDVLEGPVCASGMVFWKVHNALIPGGTGWTAEGNLTEYWLEPYTP